MSLVAEGPEMRVCGRAGSSRANASGQVRGHLVGPDDDQVEVGHQGERPAALAGAVVEDDRAGLGDRDRAAGHHARRPVEFGGGQRRRVADQLDARGQPGQPRVGPASGTAQGPGAPAPGWTAPGWTAPGWTVPGWTAPARAVRTRATGRQA